MRERESTAQRRCGYLIQFCNHIRNSVVYFQGRFSPPLSSVQGQALSLNLSSTKSPGVRARDMGEGEK